MYKVNDWLVFNPERVKSCVDKMKTMTLEEIAHYVLSLQEQEHEARNKVEWLDALAMLLRDEPDRMRLDEDGYETDEPMDEHELYERMEKEQSRIKELYYPAKIQKT